MTDTVHLTVKVIDESRINALRVEHNGKQVWLPRSQIERMNMPDPDSKRAEIVIPYWLYQREWEQ